MQSRTSTTKATPGTTTADLSEPDVRRVRSRRRNVSQLCRNCVETAIHRRFRT